MIDEKVIKAIDDDNKRRAAKGFAFELGNIAMRIVENPSILESWSLHYDPDEDEYFELKLRYRDWDA